MRLKLAEQFTYGFEIEGAVHKKLYRKLQRLGIREKFNIDDHEDGSVHVATPNYDWISRGIPPTNELAIGIFDNFNDMMKVLKMFENKKNYLENSSCGLHLHIKPKKGEQENILRHQIQDHEFILQLQKWAYDNLCRRIKTRIARTGSSYCHPYKGFSDTYRRWKSRAKHQFVRNHPFETFEFRFLSTCEHKEENVEKFFNYFFKELKKRKTNLQRRFHLPKLKAPTEIIKVKHKIEMGQKSFRIKIKSNKHKEMRDRLLKRQEKKRRLRPNPIPPAPAGITAQRWAEYVREVEERERADEEREGNTNPPPTSPSYYSAWKMSIARTYIGNWIRGNWNWKKSRKKKLKGRFRQKQNTIKCIKHTE